MQSPRFPIRELKLRPLFSSNNLKRIWKEKVRDAMKDQFISDPIDHLDFHQNVQAECDAISRKINLGTYTPGQSRRILVEKSKGLCRQLVIPTTFDAIVLQALSDALYVDIRDKAPTNNSYFEPSDHAFSNSKALFSEPEYGSYKAWLDFQKEIFRFSRERDYVVVTDIANFYDSISYVHLRNVISDLIPVREPILDMLIYVLSGLLWQPDYMPRIEIGLPQINLDAPRILAHCFLYELGEYLNKEVGKDFVRFMDDIDVGVDSVQYAKSILKSIDLVLQTRHVRLNSGKTLILKRLEARRHFRVKENALLNRIGDRINKKVDKGVSLDRERKTLSSAIRVMYRRRAFDTGNGEKILKRLLGMSTRIGAEIDNRVLLNILIYRPASRATAMRVISALPLTRARSTVVRKFIDSGMIVDDASYVETANYLVDAHSPSRAPVEENIAVIIEKYPESSYFPLYGKIWLSSKYGTAEELYGILLRSKGVWSSDPWLGRLAGGMHPIFAADALGPKFRSLINTADSADASKTYDFHDDLRRSKDQFNKTYNYLRAVNISKRTGVSHQRFLLLLSALSNPNADPKKKKKLWDIHANAWGDVYYRSLVKRSTGVTKVPITKLAPYPVP